MSPVLPCSHCGAPALGDQSRFCSFCGSELPVAESPTPAPKNPAEELSARFVALKAYPTYAELIAHRPPSSKIAGGLYAQLVMGIVFTLMAIGMTFVFAALTGPMAVVPAIMVLFGIGVFATGLKNVRRFQSATLDRYCAVVIDERVKLTGGGKNSSASTHYFASLENEAGERKEFQAIESVAANIAPGDIGIAFTKGGYLIEYIRVPV